MSDQGWKQSAVIFYAAGTIITITSFLLCVIIHFSKSTERRRKVQKMLCWCCIHDPMIAYDTVERNDDSPTEEDELLNDEIEVDIHGEIELKQSAI